MHPLRRCNVATMSQDFCTCVQQLAQKVDGLFAAPHVAVNEHAVGISNNCIRIFIQVAKQSQQLEQMSAKLKESESLVAKAQARTAHLEACLQQEGISVPDYPPVSSTTTSVQAGGLHSVPASVPRTQAEGTQLQISPEQVGVDADDYAAAGSQSPANGDLQHRGSMKVRIWSNATCCSTYPHHMDGIQDKL